MVAEIGDGLLGNWGWIILTQHVASRSHGSRLAAAKSEEGLQFPTGAFISKDDVIESPASGQACRDMLGPWVRRTQITCLATWNPLRARRG